MAFTRIEIAPYEERARVALRLFWSAAVSEGPTAQAQTQAGTFPDGRVWVSSALVPYNAALNHLFAAFGEYAMVLHMNADPKGDEYFGDAAEIAAEMCDITSDCGIEPVRWLYDRALEQIEERKTCDICGERANCAHGDAA